MSTTKHTPGPWTAQGLAIVASDRSFVGRLYPWCADPQDAECAKANARLIAAAPELLESIEQLLVCMRLAGWEDDPASIKARAATAKAKGES